MPNVSTFGLFLATTFVLSIIPGPGMLYVLARSLKGGRREGLASTLGNTLGGLCHVILAACGLSALLMTSSLLFTLVKYAGAIYLITLGILTLLRRDSHIAYEAKQSATRFSALYQGILTELLNPKTALFILALLPQFINPHGAVFWQFLLLGSITVLFNTLSDLVVTVLAGSVGQYLQKSLRFQRGQKLLSGCTMIALGIYAAVADNKA
ncbi:LysE family translocator [Ktedonosporobacter rubrisoli]|uniref:LysE family translocator n=1 Tax=Ktedonosporobacter rubrisoli TaxID=2509675 RepID=A0A4P6JND2_KTERU|nr:LysE family translocator [Ktedonosporobacter rubrisoli]QBD76236.1 LysE family translocator [Ktedonosporobacter rubrisoli]